MAAFAAVVSMVMDTSSTPAAVVASNWAWLATTMMKTQATAITLRKFAIWSSLFKVRGIEMEWIKKISNRKGRIYVSFSSHLSMGTTAPRFAVSLADGILTIHREPEVMMIALASLRRADEAYSED